MGWAEPSTPATPRDAELSLLRYERDDARRNEARANERMVAMKAALMAAQRDIAREQATVRLITKDRNRLANLYERAMSDASEAIVALGGRVE